MLRRRRMVRRYTDQPLAPEIVERVLANALRAPSAGFSQGWAFLALTDPADRRRFWPEEYAPIGGITVGYRSPDLPPQSPRFDERRRGLDDVVHRGHWGRH